MIVAAHGAAGMMMRRRMVMAAAHAGHHAAAVAVAGIHQAAPEEVHHVGGRLLFLGLLRELPVPGLNSVFFQGDRPLHLE